MWKRILSLTLALGTLIASCSNISVFAKLSGVYTATTTVNGTRTIPGSGIIEAGANGVSIKSGVCITLAENTFREPIPQGANVETIKEYVYKEYNNHYPEANSSEFIYLLDNGVPRRPLLTNGTSPEFLWYGDNEKVTVSVTYGSGSIVHPLESALVAQYEKRESLTNNGWQKIASSMSVAQAKSIWGYLTTKDGNGQMEPYKRAEEFLKADNAANEWARYLELLISVWKLAEGTDNQLLFATKINNYLSKPVDQLRKCPVMIQIETFLLVDGKGNVEYMANTIDALANFYGAQGSQAFREQSLNPSKKWTAAAIMQAVYDKRYCKNPPCQAHNAATDNPPALAYGIRNAFSPCMRDPQRTGTLRQTATPSAKNAMARLNYKDGSQMEGLNQIICQALIPENSPNLRQDIIPNLLTIEEPTGKIAKNDTVYLEMKQQEAVTQNWNKKEFTTTKIKINLTSNPGATITPLDGLPLGVETDITKQDIMSLFTGAKMYSYAVANEGETCPVTYNFGSDVQLLDPTTKKWIQVAKDDGKAKIIHTYKKKQVVQEASLGSGGDYDFYYAMEPAAFAEIKQAGDLDKVIYSENWEAMAGLPTVDYEYGPDGKPKENSTEQKQYIYFGIGGSAFVCELTGKYHSRVTTKRNYGTGANAVDKYNTYPGNPWQVDCLNDGDVDHCYLTTSASAYCSEIVGYQTVTHTNPDGTTYDTQEPIICGASYSASGGPFGYEKDADAWVKAHTGIVICEHGTKTSASSTAHHNTNGTDTDGHESCDKRGVEVSRKWTQKIIYDYMELTNVNVWEVKSGEASNTSTFTNTSTIEVLVDKGSCSADYYHGGGALKASEGRIHWGDSAPWKDIKEDVYPDHIFNGDKLGDNGILNALEELVVSFFGYVDWRSGVFESKVNPGGWLNKAEWWMDKESKAHAEKVKPTIISDYVFIKTEKGVQPLFFFTQTAEKEYRTWNRLGTDENVEDEIEPDTWDQAYGNGPLIRMKPVSGPEMWATGISWIQEGYVKANRLSYNGKQEGATMDTCSQTKFEGDTLFNMEVPGFLDDQPQRVKAGDVTKENRWFSEPVEITRSTSNGEKQASAKIYYNKMDFSWGAGPTYSGGQEIDFPATYSETTTSINSIVIHNPVSAEYAIIPALDPALDQRVEADRIVSAVSGSTATAGNVKKLKPTYNVNILYNGTASLEGGNDTALGWEYEGVNTGQGLRSTAPALKLVFNKNTSSGEATQYQTLTAVGGHTYKFTAAVSDSLNSANLRLTFLPSGTSYESKTGDGLLEVKGECPVTDNKVKVSVVMKADDTLAGAVSTFKFLSCIDVNSPGALPPESKLIVKQPVINPKYHNHMESGCDYNFVYACNNLPLNAGEGRLVWDCSEEEAKTNPDAPYHFEYTTHVHTPQCPKEYVYSCGLEDTSATEKKYTGEVTTEEIVIEYKPPADAYELTVSANTLIEPYVIEDLNGNKIVGGTFLVLDKTFKLYYPNYGNFPQQVPFGLSQSTESKGHMFTKKMDLTIFTEYKYAKFEFPVIFKGKYYFAGEIIELPLKEEWFEFTIPLAADEMKQSKCEFGAVAINSPTMLPESEAEINNYNRVDYPLAAKHSAKHVQIEDILGRIGNGTIVDSADFRYSTFFKKNGNNQTIYEGVLKSVDVTKQNNYLGDFIDILGEPIKDPFNLNTHNSEEYKSLKPYERLMLPIQILTEQFKKQEMRLGYKVFQDVETIGNYQDGYVQIVPYYYALNKKTGTTQPVDVYSMQNGKIVPINLHGNYVSGFKEDSIYPATVYLNWDDEVLRRLVTKEEQDTTKLIASKYKTVNDNGILGAKEVPKGNMYPYGDYQHLMLTGRNRTFIGTAQTYDEDRNPGDRCSDEDIYTLHGQRWHFTTGLPSSAIIVPKGDVPKTTASIFDNDDYSLITAIKAVAVGDVWVLEYDAPNPDSILVYKDNPKVYSFPDVPEHIVSITDIEKSAKDDVTEAGTH